jgi:predicted SAM-dependent methyltransferase
MEPLRQRIKQTAKKSGFIVGLVRAVRAGRMDLKQLRSLVSRRRQIAAYLAAHSVRKLQLGTSHTPLPGWLNTDLVPERSDIVCLDATRRFPFDDDTFDYVASEHMIEHVDYSGALTMLQESFRILKPGGRIRVATPDLRVLVGLFAQEKTVEQIQYIDWVAKNWVPRGLGVEANDCKEVFIINNAFRAWGHQFLYDVETLKTTMARCGFEDLRCYPPGASDDPNLKGIELHGSVIGNEAINLFEAFNVEGRVPDVKRRH